MNASTCTTCKCNWWFIHFVILSRESGQRQTELVLCQSIHHRRMCLSLLSILSFVLYTKSQSKGTDEHLGTDEFYFRWLYISFDFRSFVCLGRNTHPTYGAVDCHTSFTFEINYSIRFRRIEESMKIVNINFNLWHVNNSWCPFFFYYLWMTEVWVCYIH